MIYTGPGRAALPRWCMRTVVHSTVVHACGGACMRWCMACGACACSFSATAEDLPVPFELPGRRRSLLLSGIPSISQECAIVLRRADYDSLGWLTSVVDQL